MALTGPGSSPADLAPSRQDPKFQHRSPEPAFAWSHRSGARSCDERAPAVNFGQPRLKRADQDHHRIPARRRLPPTGQAPAGRGLPGSRDVGATSPRWRLISGVRPRSGDEPGTGQERYAGHKRDGRPDQVMSLMDAAHHEMQRVRCAGHVENPCDDRQNADGRQDDGQRPPAGRCGCGMHVIYLLLCETLGPPSVVGPRQGRRALGAAGW